jgi:Type I restriction-modification system methyltransferase subunit
MSEINNLKSSRIISKIKYLEHKLSDWTYYDAIRGRSLVTVVYLLFLKYLSDNELSEEKDIFKKIKENYERERTFGYNKNIIREFLEEKLSSEENNNIILKYINELHFESMPLEFILLIDTISDIDFSIEEEKKEVIIALVRRFSPFQSVTSLKDAIEGKDISLILSAAALLDVTDNMEIYDFSCGMGTLLTMSVSAGNKVYGEEEDIEKAVIAAILLYMAGANNPIIEVGDVLQRPMTVNYKEKLFDRIISAPPINDRNMNARKLMQMAYIDEFLFEYSTLESGAWIYARHMIQKLKANGKGILIAPISILSREGVTKEDRTRLAERGSIEAIIQLPFTVIKSAIRLCIIVLRKGHDNTAKDAALFLIDLSNRKGNDYFKASKNQSIHYEKLAAVVAEKKEIDGISRLVTLKEMNSTEMNFTPAIYLRTISEMLPQRENMAEMISVHRQLLEKYDETEHDLNTALSNYYTMQTEKPFKEDA